MNASGDPTLLRDARQVIDSISSKGERGREERIG